MTSETEPKPPTSEIGRPLVLGIDAGGTMTDTFIVDEFGNFSVGKAATTPQAEVIGLLEATRDAIAGWEISERELFEQLQVVLYSGTTMLNTLLSGTGVNVGIITTAGMEDTLRVGRAAQAWTEYSYQDRMHSVTHAHPPQLVPRRRIHGATERVDVAGKVVIPLYEEEVEEAVRALVDEGVDAIVIMFLFSFLNDANERRAREIVREITGDTPVYISAEVRPVIRELSRLNSTVVEAYAAEPARKQLLGIEQGIHELGYDHSLQTVLAYGGLANLNHRRLHETLVSGPIGGITGARYIAELRGWENILATDMGGTSFDIGSIARGHVPVESETVLARYVMNLPTISMDTIGAGSGMIVRVDPLSKKIELGPDSAGADPGPVCFDRGNEEPTICDCDLILGYLNPDYFLGGAVKLDVAKALEAIVERIAKPLDTDPYDAAQGIVEMLELDARDALTTMMSARGVDVSQFYLMAYGGAGPLHMAGYSRGLPFKGVVTFPFAAAFSAFGCAAMDYTHRYSRSVLMATSVEGDGEGSAAKAELAQEIDRIWDGFEREALEEFEVEGMDPASATVVPLAMMRYGGQLFDVEVPYTGRRPLRDAGGVDALIAMFEQVYDAINSRVARHREAGVEIHELGVLASIATVKPVLNENPLGSERPSDDAYKGTRQLYGGGGQWKEASLWEMDRLQPGNRVEGPAIVEHPATTLVVPEDQHVDVDEWSFLWLRES